ncbi:MAG TPA: hypothetical protein VNK04_07700 [Gemmataceae bacterium]|jgi:hypothetical protein|nr:hypothetical protein [Gemmataceae bacterium]
MTPRLTPEGYAQTKIKLANMEARLAALRARHDLNPVHKEEVERSYLDMIRQYRREIKLYEATQANGGPDAGADISGQEVLDSESEQRDS